MKILVFFLVYPDGREEMCHAEIDSRSLKRRGIAKIKSKQMTIEEIKAIA